MLGEIDNNHFCSSHTDPNDCHGFDTMYSDGCFRQSKLDFTPTDAQY